MRPFKGTTVKHAEKFALSLDSEDTPRCYGVKALNGKLKRSEETVPVKNAQAYERLIGATEEYAYAYGETGLSVLSGGSAGEFLLFDKPCASVRGTSHRGNMYVAAGANGFWLCRGRQSQKISGEAYTAVVAAGERIAGLKGIQVWFDDPGVTGIFSGRGAQRFNLPTVCDALVGFCGDVVYALGTTCYKIKFSADSADIEITVIAQGLNKTVPDTVQIINDKVIFAAEDGLRVIKNGKVSRIFVELDGVIKNYSGCLGSVYNGKYVLSAPNNGNRTAYVLDADGSTCVAVAKQNIAQIVQCGGYSYVLFADKTLGRFDDEKHAEARYVRSNICFGTDRCKYLRRINIKTATDVEIYLKSETETRVYGVKGKKGVQSIPISGKGTDFTLELHGKTGLDVSALEITAEIFKEVI